ncbi:MAG: hypothetical protein COS92_07155 [Desulfobacterales bacterium CG07_land_8_20_14_0_80_52_14]|nr:MAG: hypothetical protein COX20_00190 [Desulfobacterales bacterium CG23_combo_of_CG06-09_8_20_14_all_52_9]PIU49341.1 MAG: hypothetical protein COS92_07155 [Desulfobacterales bacterium CG07_land_8_20_14_0_80_52_14]
MQVKKALLILVALSAISTIQTVLAKDPPALKGPDAIAPNPKHVFRTILEGLEVNHQFKILNKGNEELKIFNVRTD